MDLIKKSFHHIIRTEKYKTDIWCRKWSFNFFCGKWLYQFAVSHAETSSETSGMCTTNLYGTECRPEKRLTSSDWRDIAAGEWCLATLTSSIEWCITQERTLPLTWTRKKIITQILIKKKKGKKKKKCELKRIWDDFWKK